MSISVYKSEEGRRAIHYAYETLLSKWPVEKTEITINTSFGETFIIAGGNEFLPPLILLHGSSSNSAMWIGDAAEYTKHFRTYAVDLPGEPGKSTDIRPPLNTDAYADWLSEVFIKLNIQKATFAGMSLGGWAGLKFAVKYPDKVEKLALLCPSGIGPQKATIILYTLPLMLLGRKGGVLAIKKVMGDNNLSDESIEYSRLISSNYNPYMGKIPVFTDDELKKLVMPVLLVAGDKDVLINSKKTVERLKAAVPKAEAVLLTGAGHGLINQRDRVLTFLKNSNNC